MARVFPRISCHRLSFGLLQNQFSFTLDSHSSKEEKWFGKWCGIGSPCCFQYRRCYTVKAAWGSPLLCNVPSALQNAALYLFHPHIGNDCCLWVRFLEKTRPHPMTFWSQWLKNLCILSFLNFVFTHEDKYKYNTLHSLSWRTC